MNFRIKHRTALHEPIECEARFFHFAASMILKRTLEAMELVLGEELSEQMPDDSAIIPLKKHP